MQIRILFFFLLLVFISFESKAQVKNQGNRHIETVHISTDQYKSQLFKNSDRNFFETSIVVPDFGACPFVAMSASWEQHNEMGEIKYLLYKYDEELALLPKNHHIEQKGDENASELVYLPVDNDSLRLKIITIGRPALSLKVHFFNPGNTEKSIDDQLGSSSQRSSICPCPQPEHLTRSQWCQSGQCPPSPSPTTTIAKHLIVHHSAGTNVSSDWSAIVRSIWDYHVNTLGWSDIGYNWLVDPEGVIYEGRGKDVLGAHFCGTNSKTMGVCMLGNYTDVTPQNEATFALTNMLAWYCCDENIDPLGMGAHSSSGLNLYRISGHRDGCATACPGDSFYPVFPELRLDVANYIDQNCTAGEVDLLVESLYTAPNEVYVDEAVVLYAKIKNNGNTATDSFVITRTLNGEVLDSQVLASLNVGDTEILAYPYVFDEEGISSFCVEIEPQANEISIDNNTSCIDIQIESIVKAKDIETNLFTVRPNPTSGLFYLDFQKAQSGIVEVFSSEGKLVVYQSLPGDGSRHPIQLDNIASGIYFLKLKAEDQVYIKKIVIQ